SYMMPSRLIGDLDPPGISVSRHLHMDELVECILVDSLVSMAHDAPVDIFRDDENHGTGCLLERSLHLAGIEQPECQVQRLPETPVGVVINVSGMDDGADSKQALRPALVRDARVVVGQELVESRDGGTEQQHLGGFVNRMYECEGAIA